MTEHDEHGLPPGLAAAWGQRPVSRRGPKPGLTIEQIVGAAMGLADAEGLPGVSMSRLAESLGFTTMSLYRYVSSKDDLVLLMVDAAYGEPPDGMNDVGGWRDQLAGWAWAALGSYRLHPWVSDAPISGLPATPRQLLWLDRILQGLIETRLSYQEQLSCALLLSGYVRDWATLTRGLMRGAEERRASGTPEVKYSQLMDGLITTERYPALAPMIAAGEFDDGADDGFDEFEAEQFAFGLDRVLDGIGLLIEQRAATR